MTAIGIYGGSFDPVHRGHLALARAAISQFHLSRFYIIPAFQPPHKAKCDASFAHRLAMARLIFVGLPEVAISDLEGQRGGISYTVDTIEALRKKHPQDELYLVVGADTLAEIRTWKEPEHLSRLVRLLVAPRTGYQPEIGSPWRCDTIRMEPVDVSATQIRRAVRADQSIAECVPKSVADYIREHGLYQTA